MSSLESLFTTTLNHLLNTRTRRQDQSTELLAEAAPDRILLGHTLPGGRHEVGPRQLVAISSDQLNRHCLLLGSSGVGKTSATLLMVDSDITSHRAFCIFDGGDFIDRVLTRIARYSTPEEVQGRLLLLDLNDRRYSVGCNPLVGEGDIYGRVFGLLACIRKQTESWGPQLEEVLRNALIALASAGWSLLEVEPLLTNTAFRQQVLAEVKDSSCRAFFRTYDALSEAKRLTMRLPVTNKITPLLAVPETRRLLGARQSFSFRRLIERHPDIIFLISVNSSRLHQNAALLGSLLLSSFQNDILSRADVPEHRRIPTHLYIDEFSTIATEHFETLLSQGRRYGLGLILNHQGLSQLPATLRDAVRINCNTQFLFQTSAVDATPLAKDITSDARDTALVKALIAQRVGEAFYVRRGAPTQRIAFRHNPDPAVDPARVQEVREAALETYGRPIAEVDRELEERDRYLLSLQNCRASYELGTYEAANDSTWEIHHETKRTFKPSIGE